MTKASHRHQILFRQEELRRSVERRMRAAVASELRQTARNVAYTYPSYDKAIELHEKKMTAILEEYYGIALKRAADMVDQAVLKAGLPIEEKAKKVDELGKTQSAWAKKNAAAKVKDIARTTRERIQAAIARAQRDALDDTKTAQLIEKRTGGSIANSRALTIARTESHAAAQAGGMIAAMQLGVVRTKEWVAAEDARTRETHADADGQTVPIDDAFNVGGVPLMFPGDPDGPPEEVINCRCVVAYGLDAPTEKE